VDQLCELLLQSARRNHRALKGVDGAAGELRRARREEVWLRVANVGCDVVEELAANGLLAFSKTAALGHRPAPARLF
jgi:hypothetical protein